MSLSLALMEFFMALITLHIAVDITVDIRVVQIGLQLILFLKS